MHPLDQFYSKQPEPLRSVFLALRQYLLAKTGFTEALKYGLPFFYYNGKRCCYFWKDKKTAHVYIGLVDGNQLHHPALEQGNRKRMKIYRINPHNDIDENTLEEVINEMLALYKGG